jgi:hypothetical protein
VRDVIPWSGRTMPGRRIVTSSNGSASSAFSARPLTRAHIVRLCSLLSAPVPDTKHMRTRGLAFSSASAAATV